MFFKYLCGTTSLVFKNNVKIILSSKSEKYKNIETWKKARYSYESNVSAGGSSALPSSYKMKITIIAQMLYRSLTSILKSWINQTEHCSPEKKP